MFTDRKWNKFWILPKLQPLSETFNVFRVNKKDGESNAILGCLTYQWAQ